MTEKNRRIAKLVLTTGVVLSLIVIIVIYGPVLFLRLGYLLNKEEYAGNDRILTYEYVNENISEDQSDSTNELSDDLAYIKALNSEGKFGIVIPAIGIKDIVDANVDPYDKDEYMQALEDSVAHAKGTMFPGQGGKIFIFSHSAISFYEIARSNINFYLLNELSRGEKIVLTYDGEIFIYQVERTDYIEPTNIGYIEQQSDSEVLILMTCWPPGMDLKRLVVTATPLP